VDVNHKYQTVWARFAASLIDEVVLIPLMLGDWLIHQETDAPIALSLWFVVYCLGYNFYSAAFHAKYGQTLGKMVMGITVLSGSGDRLSLRQACLREAGAVFFAFISFIYWLPQIAAGASPDLGVGVNWLDRVSIFGSLLWAFAELVTMLSNDKRRAIHDFIAGSVVVRTEDHTSPSFSA
jgi:uncharacterized RDD family membrane protein YckC